MMTKQDTTGDVVITTFWTTPKVEGEPNKIKPSPLNGYALNDLLVFTADSKTADAGKLIKVSGATTADEKMAVESASQKSNFNSEVDPRN